VDEQPQYVKHVFRIFSPPPATMSSLGNIVNSMTSFLEGMECEIVNGECRMLLCLMCLLCALCSFVSTICAESPNFFWFNCLMSLLQPNKLQPNKLIQTTKLNQPDTKLNQPYSRR
jgi:hypothetical protein